MLGKITILKLVYFGHIMRGIGSPLTVQIVERMVEGKGKEADRKCNGLTASESGQDWVTRGSNTMHKTDQNGRG